MLDRPIDKSDIDNRTLFKTREGGTAQAVYTNDDLEFPWLFRLANGKLITFKSNGRWTNGADARYDLISRIPTEPKMQSQVVVEDRRPSYGIRKFGDQNMGCILQRESDGELLLKNGLGSAWYLTGANAGKVDHLVPYDMECSQAPHLRLRMILEPKPA
jgi:hypothetical protein